MDDRATDAEDWMRRTISRFTVDASALVREVHLSFVLDAVADVEWGLRFIRIVADRVGHHGTGEGTREVIAQLADWNGEAMNDLRED